MADHAGCGTTGDDAAAGKARRSRRSWSSYSILGLTWMMLGLWLLFACRAEGQGMTAALTEMLTDEEVGALLRELRGQNYLTAAAVLGGLARPVIAAGTTLLVPSDVSVAEAATLAPADYLPLLRFHMLEGSLDFAELERLPVGAWLPTRLPGFGVHVSSNAEGNFSLNNARVVRPDLCPRVMRLANVACHGVSALLDPASGLAAPPAPNPAAFNSPLLPPSSETVPISGPPSPQAPRPAAPSPQTAPRAGLVPGPSATPTAGQLAPSAGFINPPSPSPSPVMTPSSPAATPAYSNYPSASPSSSSPASSPAAAPDAFPPPYINTASPSPSAHLVPGSSALLPVSPASLPSSPPSLDNPFDDSSSSLNPLLSSTFLLLWPASIILAALLLLL